MTLFSARKSILDLGRTADTPSAVAAVMHAGGIVGSPESEYAHPLSIWIMRAVPARAAHVSVDGWATVEYAGHSERILMLGSVADFARCYLTRASDYPCLVDPGHLLDRGSLITLRAIRRLTAINCGPLPELDAAVSAVASPYTAGVADCGCPQYTPAAWYAARDLIDFTLAKGGE